ncbi:class F sortase, partial [Kitasatospora sp. NPDC059571]|uniref:class F sortase n=1 Tax=Kitasatospora sp. NPDC059571 TaxID=3346871 RepID=UPI0036B027BD
GAPRRRAPLRRAQAVRPPPPAPRPPPPRAAPPRTTTWRRTAAALAITAGTALAVAGAMGLESDGSRPAAGTDRGTLPATRASGPSGTARPEAAPVRLRIPGLGLDSPLVDLQVQQDGHLAAPDDPEEIGWWSDGPRPGEDGAAIIVGHLDSLTGPAAFYNLASLQPGDTVAVDRSDHSSVTFTVQALRQYDKDRIPDDQVYASDGPPQLRLITCGGTYDRAQHEYRDNLVVYAAADPSPDEPPPA